MSKSKDKNTDKSADKTTEKKESTLNEQDRRKLNDKARYDYGILNASDMSEDQLNAEIAAIDKQSKDAAKGDAKK